MYKTIVLAVVVATAFAACGGGSGPASTPEDSFKNMQQMVKDNDWRGMMEFIPPSKLAETEAKFKKSLEEPMGLNMMAGMMGVKPEELKAMDFKTAMAKMMESMANKDPKKKEQMESATIKETKIDGQNATLTVTQGDGTETIRLVEEDGRWYMAEFGM